MSNLVDAFPQLADDRRFFGMPTAETMAKTKEARKIARAVYAASKHRSPCKDQKNESDTGSDKNS